MYDSYSSQSSVIKIVSQISASAGRAVGVWLYVNTCALSRRRAQARGLARVSPPSGLGSCESLKSVAAYSGVRMAWNMRAGLLKQL